MSIFRFSSSTNRIKKDIFACLIFTLAAVCFSSNADAQRRDHLTAEEIEIVRDAQQLDSRTAVFVKAIDRRFLVINNQAAPTDKKSVKENELWGALPIGTKQELFLDIEKILQEAIDNIDNIAESEQKSPSFQKAVRVLAEGANRFLPQFNAQLEKSNDAKERGAVFGSIEFCNEVIEAAAKVPKEEPVKETKKKKSKDDSN